MAIGKDDLLAMTDEALAELICGAFAILRRRWLGASEKRSLNEARWETLLYDLAWNGWQNISHLSAMHHLDVEKMLHNREYGSDWLLREGDEIGLSELGRKELRAKRTKR